MVRLVCSQWLTHWLRAIVQGAIGWLEENQDTTLQALPVPATSDKANPSLSPAAGAAGEVARSLVCNECGKNFRNKEQAEFHAQKTQHVDFAESTQEIAPLSAEEKKAKLEELRQKLAEKRAGTSAQDKTDQKRNEVSKKPCFQLWFLTSQGNTTQKHKADTRYQRRFKEKGATERGCGKAERKARGSRRQGEN